MIKALGHVFFAVVFLFIVLPMSRIYAADLSNASATLSTSRPSPSSPLSSNASSSDSTIDIFANGSRFLASDSAKIIRTAANVMVCIAVMGLKNTSVPATAFEPTVLLRYTAVRAADCEATDIPLEIIVFELQQYPS